jgi:hypothetical protein
MGEGFGLTVSQLISFSDWPEGRTLTSVPIWTVETAPTGSAAQFDIRIGGVSIFATLPTIDATETSSRTAAVPAVFSAAFITAGQTIAAGSSVSIHCTQRGSAVNGVGAKVALLGRRAV